jgi:hypothetical protein
MRLRERSRHCYGEAVVMVRACQRSYTANLCALVPEHQKYVAHVQQYRQNGHAKNTQVAASHLTAETHGSCLTLGSIMSVECTSD